MSHQYYLENESDTIVLDGETTDYPNITFGETNDFSFYLKGDVGHDQADATGGTASGATGLTASGVLGGTASGGGLDLVTAKERYDRLKEYGKYAGYATTSTTLGSVYFTESADFERSDVDGLVVKIRPGNDVAQARGIWGVIESLNDTTEIFGSIARIDMSVFVLAQADEYENETQVRNAFEADF